MNKSLSLLAGTGYAAIFGFSFLVTKGALDVLDPMELIFIRFFVAAIVMTVLAAIGVVKLNYKEKKIGTLAAMVLFQPILYFIFETYGVRESATSTAGIILGALPAIVALLGLIMLKERTTAMQSFGLGLSVLGVVLVVFLGAQTQGDSEGTLRGALLLIGSMLSAAFFNIFSRKASREFSDYERTFAMMWSGALVFGIIVLVRYYANGGTLPSPNAGSNNLVLSNLPARAASVWFSVVYLGVLSSVIAFFLINFSLTRLKASQSAVFTNLITVITVVAGVVVRGEKFDIVQGIGALIIILGIFLANWGKIEVSSITRNAA